MTRREARIREHIANLDSGVHKVAVKAERLLIGHHLPEALPLLVEACGHANPEVRFRAVWCLGMSRDPSVFETIKALCSDPDERVRYDAVMVLGEYGDSRALELMVELAYGEDEILPVALREFGPAALPHLKQFVGDGNWRIRSIGVSDLGIIARDHHCPECMELLLSMRSDPEPLVAAEVEYWLEELRDRYDP